MKKLSFLALAAVGLLLGACSDKEEMAEKANAIYDLIPGQNSWLAVGIALPDGGSSTRANEDLVDGLATEFEVKSAKLILFKGGTEATATYFGEYTLTPTNTFTEEGDDNVPEGNKEGTAAKGYGEITTTSQRYVTQITNPNLGAEDKLWAYVMLNYTGNSLGTGADAIGKTFAEFSREKFYAIGIGTEAAGQGQIGENGLVMTSVPIASAAGGTAAPAAGTIVTTLSEVQSDAIFETKEEAETDTNPLTCIYVERAAVKVELKNSVTTLDGTSVAFAVTNWALGNVNNNESGYYNTRQFNTDWMGYANNQAPQNTRYRMVGRTGFWNTGTHTPTGFRTYFGEDVNFDGNDGLINSTLADGNYTAFNTGDGATNILYTYENTIDENSMIYQNTTYVGVKATIGTGDDFWVEAGQPKTKLDDAAAIAGRVKANASSTFDAAIGTINAAISADLSSENADHESTSTIIAAAGVAANAIDEVSYDLDAVVTLGSVNSETGEQAYTYQITIKNIKAKKSGAEVALGDKQTAMENAVKALTDVAAILNVTDGRTNATKFFLHADGVSYYTMRIAHFGGTDLPSGDKTPANGETPWSAPSPAYNNYAKIYPMDGQSIHPAPNSVDYGESRAAAWLGRWSIVRNNWYVLDIKKVEGLGSPVPENYSGSGTGSIGGTPDDNPGREYFIAAEIHILPWVKRYQSVNF
ncbi:MAG: fimbria major subunit [Prevotella sp.]|nr:fimbria major subunit [Prevotella sp.]